MTGQVEKAQAFGAMHVKGEPVVLWNIWDAGSAKAVVNAGAKAVATGSWSVAAAQGADDGEDLPMEDALRAARQIVAAVDLPVTIDFEGGYAETPDAVAENVAALIATGAVGLNFEDRVVSGEGLHGVAEQAAKIAAIRAAADAAQVPFFINARTDVFLAGVEPDTAKATAMVMERAAAYAEAGASGLFVPGLLDLDVIARICEEQSLPVNILRMGSSAPSVADIAGAGAARISHGPDPYRAMMKWVAEATVV